MIESSATRIALNRGIAYLQSQQLQTGGFTSLSTADPEDFSEALSFQTVFATTLILQNLAQLSGTADLAVIKNGSSRFLLDQKSPHGSWNYWDRQSQQAKTLRYPDDLDDTFCALTALQLAQPESITGEVLAKAIQLLTSLEITEGGPYKTWLVKPDAANVWQDVDLGVNLNIGYFLHINGVELPKLTKLFESALKKETITTPYYPQPLPILFFAARFLHSHQQKKLLLKLLKKTKPHNSLEIALKLISLLNLEEINHDAFALAEQLINTQDPNGNWPAATFYTGVNPDKTKRFFAGSAPLTTSFALVAVYRATELKKQKLQKSHALNEKLREKILRKVVQRFTKLSPALIKLAKKYLKQVQRNDQGGQITLLPWLFCQALGKQAMDISETDLITLGAGSVYGWIAYTIYDDFLDAEADTETLPLANCCLRELTTVFTQVLPPEKGFGEIFQQILDQQEAANVWEVIHCRFDPKTGLSSATAPDFSDLAALANRSLGHSLGCIAILLLLGFTPDSTAVLNLKKFFYHFLLARQLNDDAHDWEADLARGQINAVGAKLVLMPKSDRKKLFWTTTIDWVCTTMQEHLDAAETALHNLPELQRPELLQELLNGQQRTIILVQSERKKALEFMKNYQETS